MRVFILGQRRKRPDTYRHHRIQSRPILQRSGRRQSRRSSARSSSSKALARRVCVTHVVWRRVLPAVDSVVPDLPQREDDPLHARRGGPTFSISATTHRISALTPASSLLPPSAEIHAFRSCCSASRPMRVLSATSNVDEPSANMRLYRSSIVFCNTPSSISARLPKIMDRTHRVGPEDTPPTSVPVVALQPTRDALKTMHASDG